MSFGGRGGAFWPFIAFLAVMHFGLHVGLGVGAAAPDLLTVAVLFTARRVGGGTAASFGLVGGLVQDALSLFSFGANAVALSVLGFLGARSRDLFMGESLLFLAVYLVIGKWLHDALYVFLAGAAPRGGSTAALLVEAPLAALYAAVSGVAAYVLYRAVTGEG